MANSDSFIGFVDTTLTAPAPPTNKQDSFIGFVDTVLVAPAGPYSSSLIGFVDVTITAPPVAIRPVWVKNQGVWESAIVSVFDSSTGTWI